MIFLDAKVAPTNSSSSKMSFKTTKDSKKKSKGKKKAPDDWDLSMKGSSFKSDQPKKDLARSKSSAAITGRSLRGDDGISFLPPLPEEPIYGVNYRRRLGALEIQVRSLYYKYESSLGSVRGLRVVG